MTKFLDLDPERQRHLIIVLRCLELSIESLGRVCSVTPKVARIQLLLRAESDTDELSDRQISDLLRKLDELNDADID